MSDKKISELPVASAINPADLSVLVNSGTDYQFAFSTLLGFIGANLYLGANISFGGTLPQNTSGRDGDVFINTSAGSFAHKISGTWTIVYTLPSSGGSTNGTVLFGLGTPGSATGNDNDTYINTSTGIFYKKTGGAWSQVFSMQSGPAGPTGTAGTNGANGTDGKTILSGASGPSNLYTGADGDFYINTSTMTFFGPKAGGAWPAGTSLVGAAGPAGPTGSTGATGPAGAAGAVGSGVAAGGTTGQVLSKHSNSDYDTEWIDPPVVGGITNLEAKDIVFGADDGTLAQDSDLQFDRTSKSLYKKVINYGDVPGIKVVLFGDSITAGIAGVSSVSKRFGTVLCDILGFTEINHGVGGMTMSGSTGMVAASNLATIPSFDSTYGYLIFQFGINDVDLNATDPTNFNPTQYQTDYTTVINAAIAKGWQSNRIILLTSTLRNNPTTATLQASFNDKIPIIAAALGTQYVDTYTDFVNCGGLYLCEPGSPATHPNDHGHEIMALAVIRKAILNQVYKNGQALAANGIVEFLQLVYRNFNVLNDDDSNFILGIDKAGNVGLISALKDGTKYNGRMNIVGNIIQSGAVLPSTLGAQDVVIKNGSLISSVYSGGNPALWNSIEIGDVAGMDMNFRNRYNASGFKFFNDDGSNTATNLALWIKKQQLLVNGASQLGDNPGDIWLPNGSAVAAILQPHPAAYGKFEPMDYNTGKTFIRNAWSNGKIESYVSGGTDGAQVLAHTINADQSQVAQSDIEINDSTKGIILKSPNGTRYRLTINDSGAIIPTPL